MNCETGEPFADIEMVRELIECPRCGSCSCEKSSADLFCPNCLFHELLAQDAFERSAADTPPDAEPLDAWAASQPESLGEFIEQVPSDLGNWRLSLSEERILRMNEQVQNTEPTNPPQQREAPPYELVAYPDEFKGTTWTRHGVAWPTRDGKRLKIKIFMDKPLPENGKLLLVESLKAAPRVRAEDAPF